MIKSRPCLPGGVFRFEKSNMAGLDQHHHEYNNIVQAKDIMDKQRGQQISISEML